MYFQSLTLNSLTHSTLLHGDTATVSLTTSGVTYPTLTLTLTLTVCTTLFFNCPLSARLGTVIQPKMPAD